MLRSGEIRSDQPPPLCYPRYPHAISALDRACLVLVSSVPVFFHLVEALEGIIDEETMTMEKLGRLAGRAKERPGAQQRSSRPQSYGCHRGSCPHTFLSSITHTAPLPRCYCVRCLLRQSSRRT
eukprot:scaffold1926_cov122-Isochrysis_galbana.AAC.10